MCRSPRLHVYDFYMSEIFIYSKMRVVLCLGSADPEQQAKKITVYPFALNERVNRYAGVFLLLPKYYFFNCSYTRIRILYYVTTPKTNHRPSKPFKISFYGLVSLNVLFDFFFPVRSVGFGPLFCVEVFSMEEFSVTKDGNLVLGDCDIWLARKGGPVFPISEPFFPKSFPEDDFRTSIF